MSSDWVATAIIAGSTAAVGIAGIIGTSLTSTRQQETTLTIAREERGQRRLDSAYTELQRAVNLFAVWSEATMPMVGGPEQNLYPPPPDNVAIEQASALQVYWSPEVRQRVTEWTTARNALIGLSSGAQFLSSRKVHPTDAFVSAPKVKADLRVTEDRLLAQMAHELTAHAQPALQSLPQRIKRGLRIRSASDG